MDERAHGKPLQIGIVGAGAITTNLHMPTLVNLPGVQIAWIADQDVARAQAMARPIGAAEFEPEMMASTDAILLAIPIAGRIEWLERAAAAGCAAMVEKPFANDTRSHEALLAMFPDWRLAAGYQRRFYASTGFIRRAIVGNWFGPLRSIVHQEGGRVMSGGPRNYEDEPTAIGGGLLKNLGCHGIDLALYATGAEGVALNRATLEMDGDVDAECHARLALTGPGLYCTFDITVSYVTDQSNTLRYQFDNATILAPIVPTDTLTLIGSDGQHTPIGIDHRLGAINSAQACYLAWKHFIDGIVAGVPPQNSARSSLGSTRALDAIIAGANA
jgi:predicted dehydrogenase